MEHGLDARLPRLHAARSDLPPISSGKYHLFAAVRFSRAFHFGAEPRRNRPWQALVAFQNAGGCLAKIRQSADVLCVDVRTPREKASLHGRRIRAMARM